MADFYQNEDYMKSDKKTIFITGTSSGIGKVTARYFHQKGWNVVATMRAPEKEEELHHLENVLVTKLDVQKRTSIDEAIEKSIGRFEKIDVVVNNAGYGLGGIFESAQEHHIQRQFGVNVFGLFFSHPGHASSFLKKTKMEFTLIFLRWGEK